MVFRNSLATNAKGIVALLLAVALSAACSSRGAKQVEVQCRPGQSKGADGTCQAPAKDPAPPAPPAPSPALDDHGEDDNPGAQAPSPTPQNSDDNKTEIPGTSPGPATPGPTTPSPGPGTTTTLNATDPMNANESVTTLFDGSPKKAEDGAPDVALKLVSSPQFGKVARVAFSYAADIKNAAYTYHKQDVAAKGSAVETTRSLKVEFESIPVSVNFEWGGKKCDTGIVNVGFTEKKATVTCN